ncbi:LysR family transcriptional regulator [Brachybacterium halotolerans subsp. kimchii]|uniref:LysR family transcriptional regulator n=1 Tax=Brachybacterium halotolerans TaxID=2795215 RepID=UPI001E58A97D|nr:LysR family transcriptional regulator [Brachybacterium halotolerans]UEJ84235.1 LysR family transcriptional regulator [Brachybacterium halotolerans subsp. kimchii]
MSGSGALTLPQLEAVLAVADEGSFTVAAQVLGISQPSLSRRIHSLEETLGLRLFLPVGRQMQLTDAGRRVANTARRTLQDLEDLRHQEAGADGALSGTLRAAGLPSLVATRLPRHLGAFHRAHRDVRIEVFAQEDRELLVESVRTGRADVALTAAGHVPPDLEALELRPQTFLAVVPREPDASGAQDAPGTPGTPGMLSARDLAERTLVTLPEGTSIREVTESVFRGLGVTPPRVITTTQRDALVTLAIASDGLTIVPEDLAESSPTTDARRLHLPSDVQRPVVALHRREHLRTPALSAFLETLAADV